MLEALRPGGPEIGQELLERLEPLRIDGIDASRTVSADIDQPGSAEHLEMLRHRLLGDGEMAADLASGARAVPHELENVASTWLDKRAEDCLRTHPPTVWCMSMKKTSLDLHKPQLVMVPFSYRQSQHVPRRSRGTATLPGYRTSQPNPRGDVRCATSVLREAD